MSSRKSLEKRLADALTAPDWERAGSEECPDPTWIWKAACNKLPPAQLTQVAEHISTCALCAHDLRAAREVAEECGEIELEPEPWWKTVLDLLKRWLQLPVVANWGQQLALPATAAIAVVAAILLLTYDPAAAPYASERKSNNDPTLLRGSSGKAILRGPKEEPKDEPKVKSDDRVESLVADDTLLSRTDFRLRWKCAIEATYDIHVSTVDLEEVAYVKNLHRPELRIDAQTLAVYKSGTEFLWRIIVYPEVGEMFSSVAYKVVLE